MTDTLRKVFIKTYGCQMNAYDSARMADTLAGEGFETTENADLADLILLNTCHIREKAADKVYSDIGRLRRLKTNAPLSAIPCSSALPAALPRPKARR